MRDTLFRRREDGVHFHPVGEDGPPVTLLESERIHGADVVERVREWQPDLGVSLGAPILNPELFTVPSRGTINLHLGKVPEYRGAPPGFWELWTGATEVGATVHWIDEGLDTGPVIAAAVAPVYSRDTLKRVQARAEELGVIVLQRALTRLASGEEVRGAPQPQGGHAFRSPTVGQRVRLAVRLRVRSARESLRPRSLIKSMAGVALLTVVRPVRDMFRSLTRRHPVRVFTLHRITDLCRDGMTASPEAFRRQVAYLRRSHRIVPLRDALRLIAEGARLSRPVAALTFDDGYASVFDHAAPILRNLGIPGGCCYLSTGLVGTDRRFAHDADSSVLQYLSVMSWAQVRALKEEGWDVGGHTSTHARLSRCDATELQRELTEPLEALRSKLGIEHPSMAYPFGTPNDITEEGRNAIRQLGYSALLSNYSGENRPPRDPFHLGRFDIGGDHDTIAWKAAVHGLSLSQWRRYWPSGAS